MPRNLFKPGQSGNPLGRKKGAINAKKRINVGEIMETLDFEPFKELVKIARTARSEKVRCEATIELCSYLAPKLKQVDFTGEGGAPFTISLNMFPQSKKAESITITPNLEYIDDEESKD